METAPTTHEARARNAKAQALAAILHTHGATVANVLELPAAGWSMVAKLATHAELMGPGRKVHAPGSQATIDAVARILGDLIAHTAEQQAIVDLVAGDDHVTSTGETLGELRRRSASAIAERAQADTYERPPVRTARSSQGYNAVLARIAPLPETTEADLFAPFAQADRR